MLKKIKTRYFIQKMFSYFHEGKKLKTAKYNKNLQHILDLNLINYKYFKGRYIIYEANGKGKEYKGNGDFLVFEGEISKGERNGKGKVYDDYGKLKFEGEYLNGKRNGKGKEYNDNGGIDFEGEYLDGERKGKGKEFHDNGKICFEGEYLNGIEWKGRGYDENGNLLKNIIIMGN